MFNRSKRVAVAVILFASVTLAAALTSLVDALTALARTVQALVPGL